MKLKPAARMANSNHPHQTSPHPNLSPPKPYGEL